MFLHKILNNNQVISATSQEPGCQQVQLFQEIGNTTEAGSERWRIRHISLIIFSFLLRFVISSHWDSEATLDQHLKTSHVKEFAGALADTATVEHFRRYKKIL